jgi:hypothetical protein
MRRSVSISYPEKERWQFSKSGSKHNIIITS